MATVTHRQAREAKQCQSPQAEGRPKRRRWLRWLVVLALVIVAVGLLPTIVAVSPLSRWLVDTAAAGLHGKASAASIRLGWFSAPVVEGIEIRDRQDRSLLRVEQVRAERSLLGLLLDPKTVGRIVIERPVVNVVYDGSGTNLEGVFAEWIHGEGSSLDGVDVELEVVGAKLVLTDARSGATWQADPFDLKAALPAGEARPVSIAAKGRIADQKHTGQIAITGSWRRAAAGDNPLAAIEALDAKLDNTPLEILAPLLAKASPGTELSGRLYAHVQCKLAAAAPQPAMAIETTLAVDSLVLAGPALQGDRLALDHVESTARAAWRGSLVEIERLRVESELGNLLVSGGFHLADRSLAAAIKSLMEQTYHVEGSVDLPALAAQLPHTLRLQEGTRIESGSATLVFGGRRQGEGMRWDGRLEVSRLSGSRQGHRVSWPEPILATLAASRDRAGFSLGRLECKTRHLRIDASGTPEKITGSADFHLAGLAEEAAKWIDLGQLTIAGDGRGRFEWRQEGKDGYAAEATLGLTEFALAGGGRPEWSEPELQLTLNVRGRTGEGDRIEVKSAGVELKAGEDQASAALAGPISDLRRTQPLPIEIHAAGDLARWQARTRPLLPPGDWRLAGRFTASGKLAYGDQQATLSGARIELKGMSLRGPRLDYQEPESELVISRADWRWKDRRLDVESAMLSGTNLGAGVEPLSAAWPQGRLSELNATLAVRTLLDRVQQWTAEAAAPPAWLFQGRLVSRGTVATADGKLKIEAEATVEDFAALHSSGKRVAEPSIRLTSAGSYDLDGRILQLDRVKLESGLIGAEVAGNIALEGPAARLALDGQCRYDMVRLSELARAQFGVPVYATGQNASPVSYRGPLSLAEAEARLGLAWTGAEVVGFLIGPGELEAELSGGVLRSTPLAVDLSEGRLQVAPQVSFTDQGAVLQVGTGRLADQVRITPRMCSGALQYIAPPLAGVASAEGKFSIDLDECRIPLDFPERGNLSGRMTVHSVAIGPGPLIRELATALGFGGTAQLSRESTVPFRMVEGRIYHRDLQLVFTDVTMKTYGSVGLDQSLALVVEMPVPAKWRTGNATVDLALKNQTIRLPVGGSLLEPAIDKRELERQTGQFLQGAARNVIENELSRQLERLLQKKEGSR